jgi:hypothetical protein
MRRLTILLALCAVPAILAGTLLAAGRPGEEPRADSPQRRALQGVNFISTCGFSHRNTDDVIISPGEHGGSHDHTYVGNTSTNGDSTLRSLLAAGTTCQRPGDTAAYWVPTLYRNGEAVEPLGATIYYRPRSLGRITAFPSGLKMIAGDARAQLPQSMRVTFWNCGVRAGLPRSSSVATCPEARGSSLRLHVNFPDCWNGRTLDSADHKSHMAYSENGACPASHPVKVPAISLIVRYPIQGGPGVELASGGEYSGHADFFNAWNQATLERLVERCLNAHRHCGRGV